ncbi:DUF4317 domain-containing protein [Ruminococcus sp. CLA-AA-H200]|uniref:DUF4317 domain-containing protein n=1 Tax=Ruminococcus turbiniformis TaxID=2881258 RepID=A0ABS8FWZ1_9FIRM|nr:DUF4317 domain-containing protein [Ruminococcus turbiniformis]MCC2254555.1 DUF4317 domain-containing protein [Ruminococcus turbiniformis]
MDKKEVMEIKKQFTPEYCNLTRICSCYVDSNKQKVAKSKEAFLSLPEEECMKYFEIFRKAFSGQIGKNLYNLPFPLESEKPDGAQEFLLRLRDSKLEDEELLEEFYDKVIDSYVYPDHYYIIVVHGFYDIPGKLDQISLFDEDPADNVYEYLSACICPVALSKPGLSYQEEKKRFSDRIRDRIVEKPDKAFLFPAFNDRTADIHNALYYSKKSMDLQPDLIEGLLGTAVPMPCEAQKETFHKIIEDVLGDDASCAKICEIQRAINEMAEDCHGDAPIEAGEQEIKKVLESCEIPEEKLQRFHEIYEGYAGERGKFLLTNLSEEKKFTLRMQDTTITTQPDSTIDLEVINGRKCIVIPVYGNVEVNGIPVLQ